MATISKRTTARPLSAAQLAKIQDDIRAIEKQLQAVKKGVLAVKKRIYTSKDRDQAAAIRAKMGL